MNVQRQISSKVPDSNRALLAALEEERRLLLTEKEYWELRDEILRELARGPKLERSFLLTLSVVGFLCLSLIVAGIILFLRKILPDIALAAVSFGALMIWAFVFRSYFRDVRERSGRALMERLAEIKELREANLITLEEYDWIYAAIMMSREASSGKGRA